MTTRSIYLGSASDPQPIFRNEAADSASWPEGAVMAITFTEERFPGAYHCDPPPVPVEYYGADGWPLELSELRKGSLSETMRREFQTQPHRWRSWQDEAEWATAYEDPDFYASIREQAGLIHSLIPFLPEPHLPT